MNNAFETAELIVEDYAQGIQPCYNEVIVIKIFNFANSYYYRQFYNKYYPGRLEVLPHDVPDILESLANKTGIIID